LATRKKVRPSEKSSSLRKEFFAHPQNAYTKKLLAAIPKLAATT